ncbi:MAG TPA: hypothetical protein VLA15_09485, partial [Desulfurivibrionaceae bacterium]|nr:hypothetical protein [Desulfurivibrionaceae bacterium]
FIGMSHTVMTVALGPPLEQAEGAEPPIGEGFLTVLGPLLLLGLVLLLGFYLPEPLRRLLAEAASLLEVKP